MEKSTQKFLVVGGNHLKGTVKVNGSKNATLPILAATLLSVETVTINDIPILQDIKNMKDVLSFLGANVQMDGKSIRINSSKVQSIEISEELMRLMRASNLVLGPLISRFGYAKISYPGGCNIGSRPMNLHLKGLKMMGAVIEEKFGYITAEAKNGLSGAEIYLDLPSVGATENLVMAASLAKGTTFIHNAAKEPEVADLQKFINSMGGKVTGAGSDTIVIEGVEKLGTTEHIVIPDRIEAGTYMVAAAITEGDLTITNVIPTHLELVIAKLREAGVMIIVNEKSIRVQSTGRLRPIDIKTMPYPGFSTDMQPQMVALLSMADGTSVVTETIFENRFKHIDELRRMGADIKLEGNTAIIRGVPTLYGACVEAPDLRAGAALILASMAAEDGTVIENIQHIDRGYERIEKMYNALGARIIRVT